MGSFHGTFIYSAELRSICHRIWRLYSKRCYWFPRQDYRLSTPQSCAEPCHAPMQKHVNEQSIEHHRFLQCLFYPSLEKKYHRNSHQQPTPTNLSTNFLHHPFRWSRLWSRHSGPWTLSPSTTPPNKPISRRGTTPFHSCSTIRSIQSSPQYGALPVHRRLF